MKRILQNLVLLILSTFIFIVLLEFLLKASGNVTDDYKWRYNKFYGVGLIPNQEGRYIRKNINARFNINSQGFNNIRDYEIVKKDDLIRIAVVGDSFVEAMQVNPEENVAYKLEKKLRSLKIASEVYSFGYDGFGTGQLYLLMKHNVIKYNPDFIVYVFINNDINDTITYLSTSPLVPTFNLDKNNQLIMNPPQQKYHLSKINRFLKNMAIFRYFYYQRKLYAKIRYRQSKKKFDKRKAEVFDDSNLQPTSELSKEWKITKLLLKKMRDLSDSNGSKLIIVWESDIKRYKSAKKKSVFGEKLKSICSDLNIHYLDVTDALLDFYKRTQKSIYIPEDGHWNNLGHQIVGETIAFYIRNKFSHNVLYN